MAGPIIAFQGDFSKETEKVRELEASVDSAISAIEEQVNALENCWKDEKSVAFLAAFREDLATLKKENMECRTNAENTFETIKKELKIYQD